MTMKAARLLALALLAAAPCVAQTAPTDALWESFLAPPPEARPMMRWWWFGPAVEPGEIDREIRAMKAGGIGGFEVQPVYPLSPDDAPIGLRNLPYLSDPFIAALRHAAGTARAEGMRIDVTGGSGWPFGGPHVPITQAAANIRMARVAIRAGSEEAPLPGLGPGEKFLGASLSTGDKLAPTPVQGDRLSLAPHAQPRELLVFVAGRTGQQVKRAAIGAEGYVLDHIDPAAVANHLTTVGDRLLQAFDGIAPPDAIFSDSLEAYGSSWTADLPAEFRRRRGYDLLDHLPALFLDLPDSPAIRFDWARTLSELVDERYLARIDAWARARGTRFRAQVYGFPPPTLSSNGLVALPEGEGADWRSFTSTRWATSGAHLYGRAIVSSEVWTWLRSPSWAATPLDMKVEADRHFLQGVTQLIGHGWPYTPPGVAEPGWAFYAAAALNDHNPWYGVMPDVSRYLARVSHLLRQGEPANGVAIYLPIEDAFAAMKPQRASVNEAMHDRVADSLVAQVLDSGHGFDFIDAGAIRARGIRHRVLVLPPMKRIDAEAYRAIAAWVKRGGKIVAVGDLPASAGGLRDAADRLQTAAIARRLRAAKGVALVAEAQIGKALAAAALPDVQLASPQPALGFVHRKLDRGDLYFVANTSNVAVNARARFAGDRRNGSWWDPMRGQRWPTGSGEIVIDLQPYESRLLLFSGPAARAPAPVEPKTQRRALTDWTLAFPQGDGRAVDALTSWTEIPARRYFSGTARYTTTIDLPKPSANSCVALEFGTTRPRTPTREARPTAALDAPIRDAALVRVNGATIGSLWAPPYRLDLTPALRAGRNRIEVDVSNTAVNLLAGRAPSDYRLLHARFGERFTPQDIDRIAPQPSGLIGQATLVETAATKRPCGG
jgi:hypothetical protein